MDTTSHDPDEYEVNELICGFLQRVYEAIDSHKIEQVHAIKLSCRRNDEVIPTAGEFFSAAGFLPAREQKRRFHHASGPLLGVEQDPAHLLTAIMHVWGIDQSI